MFKRVRASVVFPFSPRNFNQAPQSSSHKPLRRSRTHRRAAVSCVRARVRHQTLVYACFALLGATKSDAQGASSVGSYACATRVFGLTLTSRLAAYGVFETNVKYFYLKKL